MTAADWVVETGRRFRRDPVRDAAHASLAAFVRGVSRRAEYVCLEWLGVDTTTTRLAGTRLTLRVETPTEVARARSLNREETVAAWLLEDVDDETVFWDVGAHHGHYAVLAALRGATAVAFEPHPPNRERIRDHGDRNDVSVDCRAAALSDHTGTATLDGPAASELAVVPGGGGVRLQRGDALSPAPDVLKIDVEGHERHVLAGLEATLPSVARVAAEVHDGVDPDGVADQLEAAGLAVRELETPRSQTYLGGYRP